VQSKPVSFLTEDRALMLKHLMEKVTASGIADSWSGCGQPHNAHPTAKINKVKDLALIFCSVSLPHQDFIFYQKHLEQAFFYVIFSLTSI